MASLTATAAATVVPSAGETAPGQLRLLDRLWSAGTAEGAACPVHAPVSAGGPVALAAPETLGAFLARLTAGDACFCCGNALEAQKGDGQSALGCPACGAEAARGT